MARGLFRQKRVQLEIAEIIPTHRHMLDNKEKNKTREYPMGQSSKEANGRMGEIKGIRHMLRRYLVSYMLTKIGMMQLIGGIWGLYQFAVIAIVDMAIEHLR